MGLAKLLNKVISPLGVKVCPVEAKQPNKSGNRYDLAASSDDGLSRSVKAIMNLLHYTKQSGTTYNAELYDSGYHTIEINGSVFEGQRNPKVRLKDVPFDFAGKKVLDLGCNQGGMLFELADQISEGVGVDYDSRMINAANRISHHKGSNHLNFYVFDLEKENLDVIDNFIPAQLDIVFLLSVCLWISNWENVIDKARSVSNALLFESNGTVDQQNKQVTKLKKTYRNVRLLQNSSPDDPRQKKRKLYLCEA